MFIEAIDSGEHTNHIFRYSAAIAMVFGQKINTVDTLPGTVLNISVGEDTHHFLLTDLILENYKIIHLKNLNI